MVLQGIYSVVAPTADVREGREQPGSVCASVAGNGRLLGSCLNTNNGKVALSGTATRQENCFPVQWLSAAYFARMTRLLLLGFLFLLSLLVLFRAPTNLLWYVSILVTEFCWVFFLTVFFLLLWRTGSARHQLPATLVGLAALVLYSLPVIQAMRLARTIPKDLEAAFPGHDFAPPSALFQPQRMITGIGAKQVPFKTMAYDADNGLSLDFYPSATGGKRPCVIVIHGGSWTGGDSRQLSELSSELAKGGYHVAAINYRLAPIHHYPAPVQDVKTALAYLCSQAASLSVDTTAFTLLGRSAGGQIAL